MTPPTGYEPPEVSWWWDSLNRKERDLVSVWLRAHPPPTTWSETLISWAYTEMPNAPQGGRRE